MRDDVNLHAALCIALKRFLELSTLSEMDVRKKLAKIGIRCRFVAGTNAEKSGNFRKTPTAIY